MNSKLGDFFFPCNFKFANYIQIFFFLFGLSGYYINLVILIHSHLFYSLFVCLTNQASLISFGPAMCPSESADPMGVQVSGLPLVAPHCFPEQILSHRRVGIESHRV